MRSSVRLGSAVSILALAAAVSAHAGVLPTGGAVAQGSASISASSPSQVTVTQTSSKAIINWTSFSIGAGDTVRFDNGSGATLNRVAAGPPSTLDGLLSATGSVYLINPSGVIVGKNGVVKVGGGFVASTLDITDSAFMAGGDLTFSGTSTASVANLGRIGGLGGDVVLIAQTVSNGGRISAPKGDAGLLSGTRVTLRDQTLADGRFAVLIGAPGGSVTNSGAIRASLAELRANGGNVYALAGNTAGVIQATGVASQGGQVFLVAEGGTLDLGGTITARSGTGGGGSIETSGAQVDIGQADIDAGAGGAWLLDPTDLTIDQAAANSIAISLDHGTDVTQSTSAAGTGGAGDITVDPGVSLNWTTSAGLTLSAYRNIDVGAGAQIASAGGGAVTLHADNSGTGVGAISFGAGAKVSTAGMVSLFYDPSVNPAGGGVNSTSYAAPTEDYAPYVTGGGTLTAYMLVNSAADLQNMQNNLSGTYALGRDIDASATASWNNGAGFNPVGGPSAPFTGSLAGQGYTITGLTIDRPSQDDVGLIGYVPLSASTATLVSDLTLAGGSITGHENVGALVGWDGGGQIIGVAETAPVNGSISVGGLVGTLAGGQIVGSWASGDVDGGDFGGDAGGLAGDADAGASITGSYATGAVSVGAGPSGGADDPHGDPDDLVIAVGGLVGSNAATVSDSYATGPVSAGGEEDGAGGLIGLNTGPLSQVHATGSVSGNGINYVGGLIAWNQGDITGAYATGPVIGGLRAGGLVGDNGGSITESYSTSSVYGESLFDYTGQGPDLGGLVGFDTGPITASWASGPVGPAPGITSATVGGLVGADNGGAISLSYATGAINADDGQTVGGLVGSDSTGDISRSYAAGAITATSAQDVGGLVGALYSGTTLSQSYATGAITLSGVADYAGGLVGFSYGQIKQSYATGSVTAGAGSTGVGGLVGANFTGGSIVQAYSVGAVSAGAGSAQVGGLAGDNGGSVSDGYWDTQTSGQKTSAGGMPMTTAQLQAALPPGFDPTVWGVIPTQTFPYLLWRFPAAPEVIAGTVYSAPGGAAQTGLTVAGLMNGAAVGQATTGANGYYQILLTPGAISDADILTYLTGTLKGNAFADHVTGSIYDLDIYGGQLTALTSSASLSGLSAGLAQALGVHSGGDFLFTLPGGALTPTDGASITAAGPFTLDHPLTAAGALSVAAGGALDLDAALSGTAVTLTATNGGAISIGAPVSASQQLSATAQGDLGEWGQGAITTPWLTGATGGSVWLGGANHIAALGAFTVSGPSGFGLADDQDLTIAGILDAGTGQLWLTTSGAGAGITFAAPVSAQGTVYVSSAAGIALDSNLSTLTGLMLYAGTGIGQSAGGVISTPALTASTVDGLYLPGANRIGEVDQVEDWGPGVTINNAGTLVVKGPITAHDGDVNLTSGTGGLTLNGPVTAAGTLYLSSPGAIALAAKLTGQTVDLYTVGVAAETGAGAIDAGLLNVSAGAGIELAGANAIVQIGTDDPGYGPNVINR